jgi:hypothetical protein
MQLYSNNLIGHHPSNQNQLFSGSDNEESYKQNLKTKPIDWYYRTANISYNRNSFGHRCKEVSEVDLDNYILFAGCSFTEGYGLEIEKTYPYIVSNLFNCDYYNLAVGGIGNDAVFHNIFVWLCSQQKKPKAIVLQWPYTERCITIAEDSSEMTVDRDTRIITIAPTNSDPIHQKFISISDEINYFKTVELLNKQKINHLRNEFKIPIIEIRLRDEITFYDENIVFFLNIDYARDNHYGMESHRVFCKSLYLKLADKLL